MTIDVTNNSYSPTTAGFILRVPYIPTHNALCVVVFFYFFLHNIILNQSQCLCVHYVCAGRAFVLTYID